MNSQEVFHILLNDRKIRVGHFRVALMHVEHVVLCNIDNSAA